MSEDELERGKKLVDVTGTEIFDTETHTDVKTTVERSSEGILRRQTDETR